MDFRRSPIFYVLCVAVLTCHIIVNKSRNILAKFIFGCTGNVITKINR